MDIGVMREERNKGSYNSRENNPSLFPFGGNTTGIPYVKKVMNRFGEEEERDCSMEIIKQLFDIASLFDRVNNLTVVRQTFEKIAPIELEYRGMDKDNLNVILDDIYMTSELICIGIYAKEKSLEYQALAKGIKRIQDAKACCLRRNYLPQKWNEAVISACSRNAKKRQKTGSAAWRLQEHSSRVKRDGRTRYSGRMEN